MNQDRLLIFGTGFLACNYINYLRKLNNYNVTIKVFYNKHKLIIDTPAIEHFPMDSDQVLFSLESFKPSHILCLHGSSFVPAGIKVRDSMEKNALKTMEFLEVLSRSESRKSLKKILVIGSASEYGKYYNEAISEKFPLHATSLYGMSKISLYNASMYYYDRGLPLIYVRQFNTIGPAQRDCFVLPSFCKQVAEIEKGTKKPEIMVGDLGQERDFIDIRDTCRAYSLLFNEGKAGEVYNVSSGKCVTIRHLLDVILEVSRIKDVVAIVPNKKLFFEEHSLSRRLHADISKIRRLGFEPEITLRQTIKDTLDFWRKYV